MAQGFLKSGRLLLVLTSMTLTLLGCQKSSFTKVSGVTPDSGVLVASSGGAGSGSGFEGRTVRYIHVDAAHPCSDLLPNDELVVSADGLSAQQTRQSCLTPALPLVVSVSSLTFATDGSGGLTYQGTRYDLTPASSAWLDPGLTMVASWQAGGVTLSPNVTAPLAPDGTATASLLTEDISTGGHVAGFLGAAGYVPGATAQLFVHVKAAGRQAVFLQIQDAGTYTDSIMGMFDLQQGVVINVPGNTVTSTLIAEPNGWFRVGITGIPSKRYSSLQFQFGPAILPGSTTNQFYAGDGSSGLLFWGGQYSQQ